MKVLPVLTSVYLLMHTAYADYASDAESAIKLLQNKWYNTQTGLWYCPSTNDCTVTADQ